MVNAAIMATARPPDLDEAFRKLQESLNGLFGGGKKRGGGDDGGRTSKGGGYGLLGLGLVVLAAVWLYSAVYVVDEQEQAVVLRFGKYYETVGPGLNIYFPPIDKKYMENVTRERAYTKQGQMLTGRREHRRSATDRAVQDQQPAGLRAER